MMNTDEKLLRERVAIMAPPTLAALRTERLGVLEGENSTIRLGESGIHGVGIFAVTDIAKGDCVTIVPVDYTVYTSTDGRTITCYSRELSLTDINNPDKMARKSQDFVHQISEGSAISGAVLCAPKCDAHLGHWANDAARYPLSVESADLRKTYEEDSFNNGNAQNISVAAGVFVLTVARKPIKAGEEILVTYGTEWWKWRNSLDIEHTCGASKSFTAETHHSDDEWPESEYRDDALPDSADSRDHRGLSMRRDGDPDPDGEGGGHSSEAADHQ